MEIKLYQVDAFTNRIFGGNPAAICPLEAWLDDELLLKIAQENNLAETAYFIPTETGYHIRWFTPEIEMDLCGHATLASAHVIFEHLGHDSESIRFSSMSGDLIATKSNGKITMDFPVWAPTPAVLPEVILKGIGKAPIETMKSRDYILRFNNEEDVLSIHPDEHLLKEIDLGTGGIIVTAPGKEVDFVSRFFTPGAAVFEDPVTGSAHCSLAPYWANELGKSFMKATQCSPRIGHLTCELREGRLFLSGEAVTYLIGKIFINPQVNR